MANEDVETLKNQITDYIRLRLGDQLVDVELDPEHYRMAIDRALMTYRQRAQNSVEESYAILQLEADTQDYVLPKEIMEVRQIFRRGLGSVTSGTTTQFEPFSSGYLNTYMLQAGRVGGLLSYELFAQYQKLAMTMFGGYINFTFNKATKKLTIVRRVPFGGEEVLLWLYNHKPDITLLSDYMIMPWVQDYAYALAKFTLGEARSKFANINGPQGGTSLNGDALKNEATAEMEKLIEDLKNYVDGSQPLWWVQG